MDGNRLREPIECIAGLRHRSQAGGIPGGRCLATVLVGDRAAGPASSSCGEQAEEGRRKLAGEAGMVSKHVGLPGDASQAQVEDAVAALVADHDVHGILCQLPLPAGLDPEPVLALIPPEKDVDGLTERSMGRLVRGLPGHVGCTPLGVMRLLERYGVATAGKRATVIGRSTLTGLPQVLLLGRKGIDCTVTLAHSRTSAADMIEVCRQADIIVACAGQARMITAAHVKPGAAVVDVGVSRTEKGIVGDVDFDAVQAIAGAITPMPRGTGPMTIACLLENTLSAARMQGAFPAASMDWRRHLPPRCPPCSPWNASCAARC
ncbi:MAG: bifunctional 5,10-methylenetetrahydrofolate dehydrogenase/5,10-methenyltetrahydrofolate cyclohydrolase [Acidimicrobiaceae bacterium]|nr:bifunctional 5,10-methylenetetrahydrofolate dehydrogenase/5,10-methenyltetrahydrofolate cyclohydrolase [Acidimicrobiaceae bacterium]